MKFSKILVSLTMAFLLMPQFIFGARNNTNNDTIYEPYIDDVVFVVTQDFSVPENIGQTEVCFERKRKLPRRIVIGLISSEGTDIADVVWEKSQAGQQCATIYIQDDHIVNPGRKIEISISNSSSAEIGIPNTVVITILDDDQLVAPALEPPTPHVTLANPARNKNFEFRYRGPAEIIIYDKLGKEIMKFAPTGPTHQYSTQIWDGLDSNGVIAAPGVYGVLIIDADGKQRVKAALVR